MTTKGFDDLLEFLLIEVAFRGLQGATVLDFACLVDKFYQGSNQDVPSADKDTQTETPFRVTTDRDLLRTVWAWLNTHPDISVGRNGENNGLPYDEVEQRASIKERPQLRKDTEEELSEPETSHNSASKAPSPRSNQAPHEISRIQAHQSLDNLQRQSNEAIIDHSDNHASGLQTTNTVTNNLKNSQISQPSTNNDAGSAEHPELRIYASQDRIWRALTGHDADWRRIPKMEFDLLSTIAASGPEGILQGTLAKVSGQDKRSVPHRTDRLYANGYITKKKVMTNGSHTSLCIHRRFVKSEEKGTGDNAVQDLETHAILADGVVSYGELFKSIFSQLAAHNNIMTLQDLRKSLGIPPSLQTSRFFYRLASRIESMGCLQRVLAQAANSTVPGRRFRCLKTLREPNEDDFREFLSFGRRQEKQIRDLHQGSEYTQEPSSDLDDLFADNEDAETRRFSPQWTPDTPHANFLFNIIDHAGIQGFATKDIRLRAVGIFWRRSLDISLGRLTDAWDVTQPSNIRHLAVIRDTVQIAKNSQYVYRTYPNFQKAVDAGQTDWEAVISPKTANSKTGPPDEPSVAAPSLEGLGFSTIPDKQFVSSQGSASLSECENRAKIAKQSLSRTDPVMKILEDGTVGVDCGNQGSVRKSRHWNQSDIHDKSSIVLPRETSRKSTRGSSKKLGRPRKQNGPTDLKEARAKAKAMATEDHDEPSQPELEEPVSLSGSKRKIYETNNVEEQPGPKCQRLAKSSKRKSHETSNIEGEPSPKRRYQANHARDRSQEIGQLGEPNSEHSPLTEQSYLNEDEAQKTSAETQTGQESCRRSGRKRKRKRKYQSESAPSPEPSLAEQSDDSNSKVRINPPGSERPRKKYGRGRPPKSLVIVIKFDRLLQADWLQSSNSQSMVSAPSAEDPGSYGDGLGLTPMELDRERDIDIPAKHSKNTTKDADVLEVFYDVAPTETSELIPGPEPSNSAETPSSYATPDPPSVEQTDSFEVTYATKAISDHNSDGETFFDLQSQLSPSSPTASGENLGRTDLLATFEHPTPNQNTSMPSLSRQPTVENDPESSQNLSTNGGNDGHPGVLYQTKSVSPVREMNRENNQQDVGHATEIQTSGFTNSYRKRGVAISGGFIGLSRAKTIIQVIKQAGGVFPGGNAIWYPFVTAWGENRSGSQLDRKTLNRAIKNLIDQDKLRKVTFIFKDEKGAIVTRYVLTLPDEDPTSEKVREIQKRISDAHPFHFIPPGVEVSDELKKGMKRTLRGSFEPSVTDNVSSRVHLRANAALGNALVSINRDTGESADVALPDADTQAMQRDAGQAGNHINASKSLMGNPFISPTARFQTDDSIIVHRLNEPKGSKPASTVETRKPISNRARKSTKGPKQGRTLPSTPARSSLPTNSSALYRRALDRLHHRQTNSPKTTLRPEQDTSTNQKSPLAETLSFINKSPATYDPNYEKSNQLSIMDPDQNFYASSGTFSTESNVTRNARLDLWRSSNIQEAFEDDMPYGIQDMVPRGTRRSKKAKPVEGRNISAYDQLKQELLQIRKWEESVILDKEWQHNYGDRKLRAVRFINHNMPHGQVIRNPGQVVVDCDNEGSENYTSENFLSSLANKHDDHLGFNPNFSPLSGPRSWHSAGSAPIEPASTSQSFPSLSPASASEQGHPSPQQPNRPKPPTQALHGTWGVLVPQPRAKDLVPKPASPKHTENSMPTRRARGQRKNVSRRTSLSQSHTSPPEDSAVAITQERSAALDSVEKKSLQLAVAIVRSLTSGIDQQEVQWGLVAQACNYMRDGLTLKKCWTSYRQKARTVADELQDRFQIRFAQAYEKGDLPELDYSKLEDFDWAWLLHWARTACAAEYKPDTESEPLQQLPREGRRALKSSDNISAFKEEPPLNERFFSTTASAPYRDALVNRSMFLSPIDGNDKADSTGAPTLPKHMPVSDLEVARSWIRANCLTPHASFNGQYASEKLRKLTEETIRTALDDMMAKKTLRHVKKNRVLPGRNYDLTETFLFSFRRPLDIKHFREAAQYKQKLDSAFQGHNAGDTGDAFSPNLAPSVMVSGMAGDGEVLGVLNLVASRHLEVVAHVPPITADINSAPEPQLSKWGLTAPGYQTAQMDRKKLIFDLEVRPTRTYVYGNPIKDRLVEETIRTPPVPDTADEKAPIPLWLDINGDCLVEVWNMVLVAILTTLVSRPGADLNTISHCCKRNLERWEALWCLEWCEAVGAARRCGSGWTTSDWWWLVITDGVGETA